MELSIIKGPQLVIALDIGTTYSGYAWQHRSEFETNRNNVHFNTSWGAGALQLHKTSTCILIKFKKETEKAENKKPDIKVSIDENKLSITEDVETKIGQEAERVYSGIAKQNKIDEMYGQYYFFKGFKIALYNKHFNRSIEDQIDQPFRLFDVMALFIKALKDHCLKKLQTQGMTVDMKKTLFVVTVPAIWTEEAKKFMIDASIAAGIGNKNLLLALEPEAAAIYCLNLPEGERKDMHDLGMKGQKFLVADLGGGTADLFAVEVEESGSVREICPPLGDQVGGQNINRAFLQVCYDSFEGDDWAKTFGKATPVEMWKMEAEFEKKKVAIGSDDPDGEMIDLEVPASIRDSLHDQSVKLKDTGYIAFEDREFMFNSGLVRKNLFQETCKIVYGTIKKVLDKTEANGLRTVVLVGGFAESPIVVENIRKMIANDFQGIKVVIPSSPFKAVLNRAVLFGHNPMIIRSRISRETYGIETNVKFDPNIHDEQKKWNQKITGEDYCKNIFHIHVRKDQSVVLCNAQPVKKYIPVYKHQNNLRLPIYKSLSSTNPKYTDEGDCEKVGEINVVFENTTEDSEKSVDVSMIYGGTALSVIAKDNASGKEYIADIKFNRVK
ncbi:heat shock 70 kDa protein 12B-like isoform X2 [Ruditapes philippinarum]|uniref:heat shock 70 kDa protein 12B-like isoform X1 n=1 Tax=Ruditapes philippinarum TaxID=129788 RepID=UPI00295A750B|nr:heat shock 70 kDa protein 12B-like isoform X1 [Ruditapes philippinarum]XP_060574521.1 heat shock 70 kDa protein 12B-like isoform X2 [Ruditapes philippinarum]